MQASLAFLNGAGIRAGKSGRRTSAFLEVLNLLRTSHRAMPRPKQRLALATPAPNPSGAARGCTPGTRR